MHGEAFFCFGAGRGGAEEKNFGVGVKSTGQGGVTVKLRAFSGWGGAGQGSTLLKLIVFWSN